MKETSPAEPVDFYCQFYPGAKVVKTYQGVYVKFNEAKNNIKTVTLESGDDVAKITEFYMTQLPNPVMIEQDGAVTITPGTETVLGNGKIETVTIQPLKDKRLTEITIFSTDMEI
jgi:hypothetical protein